MIGGKFREKITLFLIVEQLTKILGKYDISYLIFSL
jgi:hypothetical protein